MRLLLFFLLHFPHFLSLSDQSYLFYLSYHLRPVRTYPSPPSLGDPIPGIHRHFAWRTMSGNMCCVWMLCVSQTAFHAIVRWPSVMVSACFVIPTLKLGSNSGCTVVDVPCLCFVVSDRKLTPIRLLLRRGWKWDGSVDACRSSWWAVDIWNWSLTCRLESSIYSPEFCRAIQIMRAWLRLRFELRCVVMPGSIPCLE